MGLRGGAGRAGGEGVKKKALRAGRFLRFSLIKVESSEQGRLGGRGWGGGAGREGGKGVKKKALRGDARKAGLWQSNLE